jgi:hypothetical protein
MRMSFPDYFDTPQKPRHLLSLATRKGRRVSSLHLLILQRCQAMVQSLREVCIRYCSLQYVTRFHQGARRLLPANIISMSLALTAGEGSVVHLWGPVFDFWPRNWHIWFDVFLSSFKTACVLFIRMVTFLILTQLHRPTDFIREQQNSIVLEPNCTWSLLSFGMWSHVIWQVMWRVYSLLGNSTVN